MALNNEYATSHMNNGEENRSKWYLSSGTPSQVPISTKNGNRKRKKEQKRSYLPISFPGARAYILWGSFNIRGCHSTKPDGIPACETDVPGPEITKRGSSLPCVFHDRNSSRAQNSRLCLHFLLALHHPSCLGGCEHGVVGGRAPVRCRCRASSTMGAERVRR